MAENGPERGTPRPHLGDLILAVIILTALVTVFGLPEGPEVGN